MKNKNGFTLVELLAVIVVLGIVVGIAIPITNNIVSKSKYKSLTVMMDEAERFVGDQWRLKKADPSSMTDAFESIVDDLEGIKYSYEFVMLDVSVSEQKELIEEMGLPSEDIKSIIIQVDENDIPCVAIDSIPLDSKLYNSKYWTEDNGKYIWTDDNDNGYYSKCCLGTRIQDYYS